MTTQQASEMIFLLEIIMIILSAILGFMIAS